MTVLFPTVKVIGWLFLTDGVTTAVYTGLSRVAFAEVGHFTPTPKIVFDTARDSEIRLAPEVNQDDWVHVWQLWFQNRADNDGAVRTARNLTALVRFLNGDGHVAVTMVGQWAVTRMPEHVGWTRLASAIDLPPVHDWGKLLLLMQDGFEIESRTPDGGVNRQLGVYALAGENLHERPRTGDHEAYALPVNICRVLVRLTAENMREQEFQFAIQRGGDGRVHSIAEIRP